MSIGAVISGATSALVGSALGGLGGGGKTTSTTTGNTSSSRSYLPFETAQNNRASSITRGAWDYAKSFYHPIEQDLINKASRIDETQVYNQGQLAQQGVEAGHRSAQRDLLRQGVTMSVQQMRALDRARQLDVATNRAAAQNNSRMQQQERNLNTLAALTGFGRTSLNSAIEASNAAAGMETNRNVSGGYTDSTTSTQTVQAKQKSGGSL